MAYTLTRADILSVPADAAVILVENGMKPSQNPASQMLAAAGGEDFLAALREKRFLPVGSAWPVSPCTLPFRHMIAVAAPRWWNGESNELFVLHRCYESIYAEARKLGCKSIATPFLSTAYYHYPLDRAVNIAEREARRGGVETIFCAETDEIFALGQLPYRKPEIVEYIGYYRDHGVFRLDNGLYAKVDLREELRDVSIRPFVDSCYHIGINPLQPPLPETEIARLRAIYEQSE